MKMLWFHLMPYTELPDDFKEKHPSVWVDIHSSLFDPKRAHHMYNDFLDELEYAAECGYDAICCNEHHSNGYGLMPSPNLIATALARRTTDTAICVMGNSLALYNPPTRVAEEFAMIDCISGGRLIAGFPVGTPMDTTFAYGQNPSQLRERYNEAHDLVMRAWQEKETFAFNGRFNQQRYVNIWPRPIQEPHPPIWIPGAGSVETWRWAAERDYVFCYLSYYGYKMARNVMKGFWAEMDRLGKDRNPYRAGFAQVVGVAETPPAGDGPLHRAGRVFLWPLPARRSALCLTAGLHDGSDAARRPRKPGQDGGGSLQRGPLDPGALGDEDADAGARHEGHRRQRLRHHRLAGRRHRAAHGTRQDAQHRPAHAAHAVRQHVEGPDQVQHAPVRREGDAAPEAAVRRVGEQVVAEAAARCRSARRCRRLPDRPRSPPNRPKIENTMRARESGP